MSGLETHYSARDIEARILAAIRAAGLNPDQRLSPEELGGLDHFHTGGLGASRVLQELAKIRAEDRILDIGAGLAGPARILAATVGCHVDCLEMSADFWWPPRPRSDSRSVRSSPSRSRRRASS